MRMVEGVTISSLLAAVNGDEGMRSFDCKQLKDEALASNLNSTSVVCRMVGLRPFRKTGFNLEVEKLSDKLVFHNYGHGGSGVTMSWGTASIVTSKLKSRDIPVQARIAVLGCGAVGLATASRLMNAGFQVKIYTKEPLLRTTSAIAGASVYPSLLVEPSVLDATFELTCRKVLFDSYKQFASMVGRHYGVSWHSIYSFSDRFVLPTWEDLLASTVLPLPQEIGSCRFGSESVPVECTTGIIVDMPVYLAAVLDELTGNGLIIEEKYIASTEDLDAIDELYIVNCMGLGASSLGKHDVQPVRGQSAILETEAINRGFAMEHEGFYLYPRRNGIVIGGGAEYANYSMKYDMTVESAMIKRLKSVFM